MLVILRQLRNRIIELKGGLEWMRKNRMWSCWKHRGLNQRWLLIRTIWLNHRRVSLQQTSGILPRRSLFRSRIHFMNHLLLLSLHPLYLCNSYFHLTLCNFGAVDLHIILINLVLQLHQRLLPVLQLQLNSKIGMLLAWEMAQLKQLGIQEFNLKNCLLLLGSDSVLLLSAH